MLSKLFSFLFILVSFQAYSSVDFQIQSAQSSGAFSVGIGSEFNLNSDDEKLTGPAVFLGSAIRPDGEPSYQMFLMKKTKKVFYIDSSEFTKRFTSKFQTILDPYEQQGGTCTGYAIYHFMEQTNLAGFEGTNTLSQVLSTEEGRANLLVDAVNQYYLNLQHRNSISGILNGYGKKFGFKCASFKSDDYTKIKTKVLNQLNSGYPVLFSFDIGPKMVEAPFPIRMTEQNSKKLDTRLWIPRKIGERNSGGHSIVAAASFELNNKTYLVMIDSDWSEPRIWDMDSYLNQKTDLGAVEFTTCK